MVLPAAALSVLHCLLSHQLSIIEYMDETMGPPYLVPKDDPVKRQQVSEGRVSYLVCEGLIYSDIKGLLFIIVTEWY